MMTTWRESISEEMNRQGESWHDVISHTFEEGELDVEFSEGYGSEEGIPFTLWTENRVYFPVKYDGSEWVGSVPRNPCKNRTSHFGGN